MRYIGLLASEFLASVADTVGRIQLVRTRGTLPIMYLGPDSLMPVASALAAVAGFVLMFWRRLVGAVRLLAQRLSLRLRRR